MWCDRQRWRLQMGGPAHSHTLCCNQGRSTHRSSSSLCCSNNSTCRTSSGCNSSSCNCSNSSSRCLVLCRWHRPLDCRADSLSITSRCSKCSRARLLGRSSREASRRGRRVPPRRCRSSRSTQRWSPHSSRSPQHSNRRQPHPATHQMDLPVRTPQLCLTRPSPPALPLTAIYWYDQLEWLTYDQQTSNSLTFCMKDTCSL